MRTTQFTGLYQSEGPFASVTLHVSRAAGSVNRKYELLVRHTGGIVLDELLRAEVTVARAAIGRPPVAALLSAGTSEVRRRKSIHCRRPERTSR